MRQKGIIRARIFDVFMPHEIGRELRVMSQWLDRHRQLLNPVVADLRRAHAETDRQGPTGEYGASFCASTQYLQEAPDCRPAMMVPSSVNCACSSSNVMVRLHRNRRGLDPHVGERKRLSNTYRG